MEAEKKAVSTSLADATETLGSGMRVLIVDDVRDTMLTLGILLRSEGFAVEMVNNGAGVVDAVRRFRPHAVLLDLHMPDRNGCDVAMELRREHGDACPTLIAVTALKGDITRRVAERSGIEYYVVKPYDPDALIALLASVKQDLQEARKKRST